MAYDQLYREELLAHYQNPHNFKKPVSYTHHASHNNPLCGDKLEAYVTVHKNRADAIYFTGSGCAIAIGLASMLSEKLSGKKIGDIMNMGTDDVLNIAHINPTPTRLKCALLSLEVLQKALRDNVSTLHTTSTHA